jgi:hypothetical protein
MQENRSFDHYFGTLSGVRGFSDPAVLQQTVGGVTCPVFDQFGFQPGTGVDASGYPPRPGRTCRDRRLLNPRICHETGLRCS